MKNLIIPALALLVGVSAMAPTVQAASGPVTKQELREYTQRCQSIRDAAQKCAAIRMETVYLDGDGKVLASVRSDEVAPAGDEHSGSLVEFTLPEEDCKLYWGIIGQ